MNPDEVILGPPQWEPRWTPPRDLPGRAADYTGRLWDQLMEADTAAEQRDEAQREARYARYLNRPHHFQPASWWPVYCDLCGLNSLWHGDS